MNISEIIAHARALEAAATKGPWYVVDDGFSAGISTETREMRKAAVIYDSAYPDICGGDSHEGYFIGPNADFIAMSRTLIPLLLDIAEKAFSMRYADGPPCCMLEDRLDEALSRLAAVEVKT